MAAATETLGAEQLPDGKAYYAYQIGSYTTVTEQTSTDIHNIGLGEVARIRAEMEVLIAELEFEGDFEAFTEFLRTDPQFYYDNPDDLYTAYLATCKRIDPELVKLFGRLPRMPYGVKPIPSATAPDTTHRLADLQRSFRFSCFDIRKG